MDNIVIILVLLIVILGYLQLVVEILSHYCVTLKLIQFTFLGLPQDFWGRISQTKGTHQPQKF